MKNLLFILGFLCCGSGWLQGQNPPCNISVAAGGAGQIAGCRSASGSMIAIPSPNVPGYQYLWSTGGTTQTITGCRGGVYGVTVTDSFGCTASAESAQMADSTFIQSRIYPLSISTVSSSCASTSTINVTMSRTAPYAYLWSNGATTEDLTGISSGAYRLTVTDANGCIYEGHRAVSPITVSIFSINPFNPSAVQNVACNANGTARLHVHQGVSPYSFVWSNGVTGTTDNASGGTVAIYNITQPGTYSVSITDASGCSIDTSFIVGGSTRIVSTFTRTGASNATATNGSVDLSVSGGLAPYAYRWSNGATTQDLSGLPCLVYYVTITDANTCQTTANVTVPCSLTTTVGEVPNMEAMQVYPNPLTQASVLEFELEESQNISLHAYNQMGQMVGQIHRGEVSAGKQRVSLQTLADLPKGFYYLQLQSDRGIKQTLKICIY